MSVRKVREESGLKLSEHFTLRELTASHTALSRGWENVPPPEVMPALRRTAAGLELIRALLTRTVNHPVPLVITSGYRSPRLNAAVGSKPTSQHVLGEAADFTATLYGTPPQIVRAIIASDVPYDQVISEASSNGTRWVHVSFSLSPRRQALEINANGTRQLWG